VTVTSVGFALFLSVSDFSEEASLAPQAIIKVGSNTIKKIGYFFAYFR
jgi:hypothetical protein